MPRKTLEFANFVCTFGDFELLDFAQEIVLPALLETEQRRIHGKTSYFFYKTHRIALKAEGQSIPAVVGYFVKKTELESEQHFDEQENQIVYEHQSIPSAPTAQFLLLLHNHVLLYLHDSSPAPSLREFRTTVNKFIKDAYSQYTERLSRGAAWPIHVLEPPVGPISKSEVRRRIPPPTVQVLPLTTTQSVSEFINRFFKLQNIIFELSETNSDMDDDEFFQKWRENGSAINTKKSLQSHTNNEGLNKTEAIKQVTAASNQGINTVRVKGTDRTGGTLKGDNFDISAKTKIEVPDGAALTDFAVIAFEHFNELVSTSIIRAKDISYAAKEKIQRILDVLL